LVVKDLQLAESYGENKTRNFKMNIIPVNQAKNNIEQLVEETNETHQPILLIGEHGNAVLISEGDWSVIQEMLYLQSIPGMIDSIHQGGNTSLEECIDEQSIRNILNG
jgi:antitoxin YefM